MSHRLSNGGGVVVVTDKTQFSVGMGGWSVLWTGTATSLHTATGASLSQSLPVHTFLSSCL